MKIQAVSNQNFNGQLVYMTKNGEKIIGKEIRYHLPSVYRTFKDAVADSLKGESFDVFISRADNPLHFNIKASDGEKSTDNLLVKLNKKRYYTEAYHYTNADDMAKAVFKSISEFKNGNVK